MVYRNGKKIDSPEEMEDEEDSGEQTTLIPKSLLPDGVKAGDEVRLKVVHSYDDELEVSYQHSKSDNNKMDEDEKAPTEKEAFEEISADA